MLLPRCFPVGIVWAGWWVFLGLWYRWKIKDILSNFCHLFPVSGKQLVSNWKLDFSWLLQSQILLFSFFKMETLEWWIRSLSALMDSSRSFPSPCSEDGLNRAMWNIYSYFSLKDFKLPHNFLLDRSAVFLGLFNPVCSQIFSMKPLPPSQISCICPEMKINSGGIS